MAELWDQKQKKWIKHLWQIKPNTVSETLWSRVSEMVGLFGEEISPSTAAVRETVPVGADCTLSPVKRLVCSPDLPVSVFSLPAPNPEEAAVDSSTTPDKFTCSYCSKTFSQKNTYQNHLRSHGKEGDDPYQCNYCGKTFAVPARLTRHYRTHTGEKPYKCDYCDKSFSVKENLSVHRRIHTKERPYKCDICERAFEHSGKLHRHMRIHTGERPHKCSICNKTFIQSGQLVIHMRTHTGEKPYVCKSCGKGFTCSKQLKVHTRTHTGEKPYSCEICGKAFGYNHVLKLHQVSHYGEKVYKCTICSETFNSKKNMESHIKSHSENAVTAVARSGAENELSSSSDKENKFENPPLRGAVEMAPVQMPATAAPPPAAESPYQPSSTPSPMSPASPPSTSSQPYFKDLNQFMRQPSGLDPALLAAAAVASANESEDAKRFRRYLPMPSEVSSRTSTPEALPVTEPSVCIIPDSFVMHRPGFPNNRLLPLPLPLPQTYTREPSPILINIHSGTGLPVSNSLSLVPSSSPDPVDLRSCKEELNLPLRKRKTIFRSTESPEREVASVRYNSVIHYAKAS
ncbi:unnamed protein product [Bemisia tabaci]|uniref:C2H2-type domain-containing protein n=2 Tax=Bemisia tabaci TaxID=7038 RepID=A0A9P0CFA5_BEMTA|nr:unnamed protein product [Bemisia tabaci]